MTDNETLKWPGAEWDALWEGAKTARLQQLTRQQGAPSPHELTQMLERLASPEVAGRDIGAVRLKWTAGEEFQGPAPVPVLRRRLDAHCAQALAEELARMSKACHLRGKEVQLAHAALAAVLNPGPTSYQGLEHVVDGHWTATGMRQTLADYARALSYEGRVRVSRVLRLLYTCAPEVNPTGGGTPPRDMTAQFDQGRVDLAVDMESFDVDYDPYPGELTRAVRPVAWELHAQLAQAWNDLGVPERRLVVAYWHRMPLHGPHVAAGLPQPTALQMWDML